MELTGKLKDMYHERVGDVSHKMSGMTHKLTDMSHKAERKTKRSGGALSFVWGATKRALILVGIGKLVKRLF